MDIHNLSKLLISFAFDVSIMHNKSARSSHPAHSVALFQ